MTEETVTKLAVRRFLLGELDDRERQRIEELFISDSEAREKILLAEDELIEDYLDDLLTPPDRDRFMINYLSTPHQRRKVRIARSIKKYAVAEAVVPTPPTPETTSTRQIFRGLFGVRRLQQHFVLIPLAAALALAVVLSFIWLVRLDQRGQENERRRAIEAELAHLNSSMTLGTMSPVVASVVLPPVSLRSATPAIELKRTTGIIELRLLWTQKEVSPSYSAALHRVGSEEEFTIHNLHVEHTPSGNAARVRLPAHLLNRGSYYVVLSSSGTEGKSEQSEEYGFVVSD